MVGLLALLLMRGAKAMLMVETRLIGERSFEAVP